MSPVAVQPHEQEHPADHGGNVSIGDIPSVPCAAVTVDESTMLAALLRREGESLVNLLNRLDEAVGKAFNRARRCGR